MNIEGFTIRQATPEDTSLIYWFIKQLAEYEKLPELVTGTEEVLRESIFEKRGAEVIIGELAGKPAAFSLFFHNFSTFQCRPGLYLEDLFVIPEMRGKGIGKAMLVHLANIAIERGCGRFEWICLDWNEDALGFYRKIGAVPMEGWTIQRLEGDSINSLARQ